MAAMVRGVASDTVSEILKKVPRELTGHLHHLMVCTLAGRHLPHPTGKVALPTSRTICAVLILHRKMTWTTTA